MPCHTPQLYATVVHASSGEVMRRLGPFRTAHEARTACGTAAGQVLTWERGPRSWQAEKDPLRFQVPAENPADTLDPA